jgi:hypothetical protein
LRKKARRHHSVNAKKRDAFIQRRFYTQNLLHKNTFTHRRFHTETFFMHTHRRISTQRLLHENTLTHRRFYTQTLLHTYAFTCRCLFTDAHTLSHTNAFTHRRFRTQTLNKKLSSSATTSCIISQCLCIRISTASDEADDAVPCSIRTDVPVSK